METSNSVRITSAQLPTTQPLLPPDLRPGGYSPSPQHQPQEDYSQDRSITPSNPVLLSTIPTHHQQPMHQSTASSSTTIFPPHHNPQPGMPNTGVCVPATLQQGQFQLLQSSQGSIYPPQYPYHQPYPPGGQPVRTGVPYHVPPSYVQRSQYRMLEAGSVPVDHYRSPMSPYQAAAGMTPHQSMFVYRRPPQYPYSSAPAHSQFSPPHAQYHVPQFAATPPRSLSSQSLVHSGPTPPTLHGPPPYGAPGTPIDPMYYYSDVGTSRTIPLPLSRGAVNRNTPAKGDLNYLQGPPAYNQYQEDVRRMKSSMDSNTGFADSMYPSNQLAKPVTTAPPQDKEVLRLTFPVKGGVILKPFQLEHGKDVSQRTFLLKDSFHKMLLSRNDLELQFSCYHHDDKQALCNWPNGVEVGINEMKLQIDRGDTKHSHQPLHIKHFCSWGTNLLEILVTSCCSLYLFVLQLVHRPSVNSVRQGLLRKRLLPTEHCMAKIKRWFDSNPNIKTGVKVSLKCPVTFKRMKLPSRGAECKHIQCFDLEAYLQMNCDRGTWKCPVCGCNAILEGLEIDQYIWSILTQVNTKGIDVDEVTFDPSAAWSPVEKPEESRGDEVNTPPRKKVNVDSSPVPSGEMSDNRLPASNIPNSQSETTILETTDGEERLNHSSEELSSQNIISNAKTDPTQSLSLFNEAMREGCVTLELLKMLISGVAGSGKTSTLALLLGVDPPAIRKSTPCACRPVHVIPIVSDLDDAVWYVLDDSQLKSLLAELVRVHEKIDSRVVPPESSLPTEELGFTMPEQHTAFGLELTDKSLATIADQVGLSLLQKVSGDNIIDLESLITSSANASNDSLYALLESSATEDELVRLIDQSGRQDIHLKRRWISITDTGGQPQFREVLPVFLRQTSLFVHVQKLSEALSDKPVIEYYDDQGKPLSKPIKSPLTNEEHVKCAVRSVQSLRYNATYDKCPKMLFVATHEDEERKSSETRDQKEEKMADLVLPISSQDGVIYCGSQMKNLLFGVNAKCPGKKETLIAATIRNIINGLFPPTGKKIPLRWFVLQLKLQEIARVLGRLVITKQECLQAAKRIHLNSEEALDAALEYLDELNIIFYYPKYLPGLVFCNIQVIIDKLTELVEHLYKLMEDSDDCSAYTGDWKKFREFGLITEAILANFPSHYSPGIFTFHHLIKLFRSLLVIADFQRDNLEKQEYFMPCLLHTIEPGEVAKHKADSKPSVPSLVLHFPNGLLSGVFCFMIASLLSADNTTHIPWKLLLRGGSPKCLYRNIVQFTLPGDYPGVVTLIDMFDFIEIVVGSCPPVFCGEICPEVKKAVLHSLAKVMKLLNYIPCDPEEAILCPCEQASYKPHPAKLKTDRNGKQWWVCSKVKSNCKEVIEENHDVWNDERMNFTPNAGQYLSVQIVSHALQNIIDWHSLGMFLGIKKAKLDEIRLDYDKFGQARQKKEMIDLWLRSDSNASWEKLCTALESIDEGSLADQIKSTYVVQ